MYTILMLNQKGGVGKTTIADELSFALERRGKTVAFVTTDPQGGSVHEVCNDPDFAEECDFQVVDTAGVLVGGVNDWCRAANLILVPMLPSTRDMEPTLRTLDIVRESGTGAKAYVIVNNFYAYGTLDRQLVEYLEGEEVPIIAKIPRAVALSRAAAAGVSVAEYDPYREHVRYRSFLTREGTPVDTGLEVHGSTHDDGTADNHGEGTGELTAAALHTVLDGKTKVHKAEDDEDAAEGGHTIREKVFHVFQHG